MGGTATRQAFGEAILEVGADERVVVIDGDLKNSTHTEDFLAKYPERFIELGIAESNMIGVAAGLALSGKIPFACSFSAFVTGRQEVIRVSVCYNRANHVRLVGTHVGVGIGDDGATQMALMDIAAMRAMPNMAVVQPCDRVETIQAVNSLLEHDGPVFFRLMRQKTDDVHDEKYIFNFGKIDTLRDGKDVVLFATGSLVQESLKAAAALDKEKIRARVVNVHTLKPVDVDGIAKAAKACGGNVVTAEDHAPEGGLGSVVAEALTEAGVPATMKRIAVHGFGESGTNEELYDRYGLSAKHIADAAKSLA